MWFTVLTPTRGYIVYFPFSIEFYGFPIDTDVDDGYECYNGFDKNCAKTYAQKLKVSNDWIIM